MLKSNAFNAKIQNEKYLIKLIQKQNINFTYKKTNINRVVRYIRNFNRSHIIEHGLQQMALI